MPHEDHEKPIKVVKGKVEYDNPELPLDEAFLKANPWNGDVHGVGISGTLTPVMPSSEAAFFDFTQSHAHIQHVAKGPSGINYFFPFPSSISQVAGSPFSDEWWGVSGVFKTYPPDSGLLIQPNEDDSGIFHFNGQSGLFSLTGVKPPKIDFNLFSPFIHHGHDGNKEERTEVPFISDYTISLPRFPYPYGNFSNYREG